MTGRSGMVDCKWPYFVILYIGLLLSSKRLLQAWFSFPSSIAFIHIASLMIYTQFMRFIGRYQPTLIDDRTFNRIVMPLAIPFTISLITFNYALKFLPISFISMISIIIPSLIYIGSSAFYRSRMDFIWVLISFVGVFLIIYGQIPLHIGGFICIIISCICEAIFIFGSYPLLMQSPLEFSNFDVLAYVSPLAALCSGVAVFLSGEFYDLLSINITIYGIDLVINVFLFVLAFHLNFQLSADTRNFLSISFSSISNLAKDIVAIFVSLLILNHHDSIITPYQVVGYFLCLLVFHSKLTRQNLLQHANSSYSSQNSSFSSTSSSYFSVAPPQTAIPSLLSSYTLTSYFMPTFHPSHDQRPPIASSEGLHLDFKYVEWVPDEGGPGSKLPTDTFNQKHHPQHHRVGDNDLLDPDQKHHHHHPSHPHDRLHDHSNGHEKHHQDASHLHHSSSHQNSQIHNSILFIIYALIITFAVCGLFTYHWDNEHLHKSAFVLPPFLQGAHKGLVTDDPLMLEDSSLTRIKISNSDVGDASLSHVQHRWTKNSAPQYTFNPSLYEGITIRAAVYYGRRDRIRILEVYLRRNLKKYGGILDSVVFLENAKNKRDVDYLNEVILPSQPGLYSILPMHDGYSYDFVKPGELYFKIDDDVVFIEDGTFENMLAAKAAHPETLFVSANVVNHPRLTFVHNLLGAYKAYFLSQDASWSWRNDSSQGLDSFYDKNLNEPLRPTWNAFGSCSWASWKCAWLAHENFLWNFYHSNLDVYRFRIIDLHAVKYERWSINFVLINGSDFVQPPKDVDDEEFLSTTLPKQVGRHSIAAGYALVAHFSFFTQNKEVSKTDLLDRYLKLAKTKYGTPLPLLSADISNPLSPTSSASPLQWSSWKHIMIMIIIGFVFTTLI